MAAAAVQELVRVRWCSVRQPGATADARWLELTVRTAGADGEAVAVYR